MGGLTSNLHGHYIKGYHKWQRSREQCVQDALTNAQRSNRLSQGKLKRKKEIPLDLELVDFMLSVFLS
jgi:hypothetical protein